MSFEALARVPVVDWLMALAVLTCGAVAIAASCRWTALAYGSSEEGGTPDEWPGQLALPPAPNNDVMLDDVDRALWEMIDSEYRRDARRSALARVPRWR